MDRTFGSFAASAAAIAVVASALIASSTPAAARPDERPRPVRLSIAVPTRSAADVRVLLQKGCVTCHAIGTGATAPRVGPPLDGQLTAGTVMDLAGALWNHAPVMVAKMAARHMTPPAMSPADVAEVVSALSVYRVTMVGAERIGDATAGARVFHAKGCSGCHAVDGRAWDGPGPNLEKYRGPSSGVFLAQAMWNHSASMEAAIASRKMTWPRLTGREMGDLIAFVRGDRGRADGADYFEPGDPRRGADLFGDKCAGCHAVQGRGARGGPDLADRPVSRSGSVAEIAACMWNHSPAMSAEAERRGLTFAAFSGQEMIDVIAYVNFISFANPRGVAARGRALFASRCRPCHGDAEALPRFDEPFAMIAAMWNHAPRMSGEFARRHMAWPRFANGEAADLAAYLISRR